MRAYLLGAGASLAAGAEALCCSLVAGPREVPEALIVALVTSVMTASQAGQLLESMAGPEVAPPGQALESGRQVAAKLLAAQVSLAALLGAIAVWQPRAMFALACLGLSNGLLWLGLALIARHRERHWFHGRLLVGSGRGWRPARRARFYLERSPEVERHGAFIETGAV